MDFHYKNYNSFQEFLEAYLDEEVECEGELYNILRDYLWHKLDSEGLTANELCLINSESLFEQDEVDYQIDAFDLYKGWESGLRIYQMPFQPFTHYAIPVASSRGGSESDNEIYIVEKRAVTKIRWQTIKEVTIR